jgi:hypothetical protein
MVTLCAILVGAPPALRPTYHPVHENNVFGPAAHAAFEANKADVVKAVDARRLLARMRVPKTPPKP